MPIGKLTKKTSIRQTPSSMTEITYPEQLLLLSLSSRSVPGSKLSQVHPQWLCCKTATLRMAIALLAENVMPIGFPVR